MDEALKNAQKATNTFYDPATQFAGSIWDKYKGVLGEEKSDYGDFLSRYSGAIKGQEVLPHMFDRIGRELNIPNLRQAATSAQNTLTNLPYAMSSSARGFDVSGNQLTRATAQKMSNLAPVVQTTANSLNSAYDELGRRVGYTQTEQAKQLQPFEKEQNFLTDYLARKSTGFTFANEKELSTLLAKAQSGMGLTDSELSRANAIALQKLQNDAAMDRLKTQIASTEKLAKNNNDPLGLFG